LEVKIMGVGVEGKKKKRNSQQKYEFMQIKPNWSNEVLSQEY
jgi:hypothetical protein